MEQKLGMKMSIDIRLDKFDTDIAGCDVEVDTPVESVEFTIEKELYHGNDKRGN